MDGARTQEALVGHGDDTEQFLGRLGILQCAGQSFQGDSQLPVSENWKLHGGLCPHSALAQSRLALGAAPTATILSVALPPKETLPRPVFLLTRSPTMAIRPCYSCRRQSRCSWGKGRQGEDSRGLPVEANGLRGHSHFSLGWIS